MKLALECRTDMLEMVQPFADFDFVLVHKVLEDEKYAEWYKDSSNVKFLDNSVNELGEPYPIDKIQEAAEAINATYIVAPDYLGDAVNTVKSWEECIKKFPPEKVVAVIQGKTFEEAYWCLNSYGNRIIAVPYDICSQKTDPPWLMGQRRALFIAHVPREQIMGIHLLGFTGMDEFFWYQNNPMVATIDTGVPILLGLNSQDILEPLESKEKPTYNEMEKIELSQQGWTGVLRNLALLRRHMP